MISDAIINLVQTTVSQELLEFNFSVECNIYNMAESDIETEYSETDNASNYRKGVLGNYVCFRVLRCNGRHVREDEGVEWTDVTCFANGAAVESLSAKSGDISVGHDMVERDNLFTKYSPSSEGFSYWWMETRESEEDDTKPDDFQYAVNFGKYFSAHNWADADFADNTFDYFSNGDSKRDENINYDESEEPSSNSISISYAFHDGDDSRHTYYAEFLVPHIDEEDNVHWEARSYYVYPWDDTIAYHSEYVNGSCELEPSSDIISAEFSNGSSGVDNYRIFVRRLREFDRKKFYRIDFDLRKITDPKGYIITPYAEEGGSINPSYPCEVQSGGSQSFHVEANQDYHIESVLVDENTENERDVTHELVGGDYLFSNVIADHTIHAYFAEGILTTYIIESRADGQGSIIPEGIVTVNEGETPAYIIRPNPGHSCVALYVDYEPVAHQPHEFQYRFEPVHADHIIVASFKPDSYFVKVYANPIEGGNVSCNGEYVEQSFEYGYQCTINAVANENFVFINWVDAYTQEEVTTNPEYTFTVISNREFVANFESTIPKLIVTAVCNPANAGEITGAGEYDDFDNVEMAVTANEGYRFVNWTENGSVVSTNAEFGFVIHNNRSFIANFAADAWTITANTDGNGSITPGGIVYAADGSEPSFVMTPDEGYFIIGVLIDGVEDVTAEVVNNTYVFPPVHADHTIYVTFSSSHVIIAHAEEGGSITPDGNVMVAHHADQTFVITPNAGNETVAIYVDGESIMPSGTTYDTPYTYTFEDVVANHEIWASFKPKQYYVNASVSPTGAGLVNGESEVTIGTTYGTTIELTAEAHAGYAFENWTENGSVVSTNASLSVLVNDNRTFVAHFASVPTRNVLAKSKPASGGYTTGSGDYSLGSTATVTAVAAEGWGFVKWTDVDETETYSTNPSYSFTVNDDVVVYALFIKTTPDRYTITTQVSPAGSGTASGGGEYDDGSQHTLTAIPSANYHFVAWKLNNQVVSTSDTFTITVTGDAVYVACFEIDRYSVTTSVSPNGSGTASGGGEYDAGSSVTITAVAAAGYEFVEWRNNGTSVSSNPQYTFTLASNMNFTAVFRIRSYSISAQVSPAGSGTASGGGSYTHGSSVTLIATAAANYAFVNWTENGSEVSTNDHYAFTANADRVVVANFARVYTINVVSDPAEGGVTHGCGQYASGATASIWVTPNGGFNNPQWLDGYGMADVPRNVVVTGDATYTAYYKESMKHIVANVNPSGSGKLNGDNPPLDGDYAMGQFAMIEATPTDDNTYQFYRWTEGGTEVEDNAVYVFQPVTDRNLIANFKSRVTLMVGHIVNGEFYEDGSRATVSPSNSVFVTPNGNQSFNVVVTPGKNYGITQIIDVTTGSVLNLNQHPTSYTYTITNVTSPHKIRVIVEQQ